MGNQQLLLVIVGIIVVGIAILVGAEMFRAQEMEHSKESIRIELMSLAQDARQYYLWPPSLGGGGHTYLGYIIPSNLVSTQNAEYSCTNTDRRVFFKAISRGNTGNTVSVTLRRYGTGANDLLEQWVFTGAFE